MYLRNFDRCPLCVFCLILLRGAALLRHCEVHENETAEHKQSRLRTCVKSRSSARPSRAFCAPFSFSFLSGYISLSYLLENDVKRQRLNTVDENCNDNFSIFFWNIHVGAESRYQPPVLKTLESPQKSVF